jgi:RimJ/RimL family protein N-acetyltransferase
MQQILQTSRLTLRPCAEADMVVLHYHWMEPEVRHYLWDGRLINQETVLEFVNSSLESSRKHGYGLWILLTKPEGTFCGVCGLRDGEVEGPDLLYSIAPKYWSSGFATESAGCVLQYGFAELGLRNIVATVDKPNVASIRVLEKLGLHLTGEKLIQRNPILYYTVSRERFFKLHGEIS